MVLTSYSTQKFSNSVFFKPIEQRLEDGNLELPIDEELLNAIHQIKTPNVGVAVGFDRLLMTEQNASSIEQILPIST